MLSALACGEYHLSWYDGKRKHLDPVGNHPEAALNALQKKRIELAYLAAGGEIKQQGDKCAVSNGQTRPVIQLLFLQKCGQPAGSSSRWQNGLSAIAFSELV